MHVIDSDRHTVKRLVLTLKMILSGSKRVCQQSLLGVHWWLVGNENCISKKLHSVRKIFFLFLYEILRRPLAAEASCSKIFVLQLTLTYEGCCFACPVFSVW